MTVKMAKIENKLEAGKRASELELGPDRNVPHSLRFVLIKGDIKRNFIK